jgi:hypothetical protein
VRGVLRGMGGQEQDDSATTSLVASWVPMRRPPQLGLTIGLTIISQQWQIGCQVGRHHARAEFSQHHGCRRQRVEREARG